MSLIKCAECGHEISTEAKVCPNCGKPNPAPPTMSPQQRKGCFIVVAAFIGAILIAIIIGSIITHKGPPVEVTDSTERQPVVVYTGPRPPFTKRQIAYLEWSRETEGRVSAMKDIALDAKDSQDPRLLYGSDDELSDLIGERRKIKNEGFLEIDKECSVAVENCYKMVVKLRTALRMDDVLLYKEALDCNELASHAIDRWESLLEQVAALEDSSKKQSP